MTKAQLDYIRLLAENLGWDGVHLRRLAGFNVFAHFEDTSPVLARSVIGKLEQAHRQLGKALPQNTASQKLPAPKLPPARPTALASAAPLSTPKQCSFINSLLRRHHLSEHDGARLVGGKTIAGLDLAQASNLIERLLAMETPTRRSSRS